MAAAAAAAAAVVAAAISAEDDRRTSCCAVTGLSLTAGCVLPAPRSLCCIVAGAKPLLVRSVGPVRSVATS